ncbi:hypothetical protein [Xenorhabdus bovienii]|uniref:hypothetical protein n=1 Tax=Xenorhabdus bovienii TaxID=40576 RepID=UPI00237C8D48|nr:hypothetical protein [Xenorhabdus bovienii]MDE1476202.1 hypothetical protein [Xenorhabdus bovienii]
MMDIDIRCNCQKYEFAVDNNAPCPFCNWSAFLKYQRNEWQDAGYEMALDGINPRDIKFYELPIELKRPGLLGIVRRNLLRGYYRGMKDIGKIIKTHY